MLPFGLRPAPKIFTKGMHKVGTGVPDRNLATCLQSNISRKVIYEKSHLPIEHSSSATPPHLTKC